MFLFFYIDDLGLDGIPHLELELTVLLVEREHAKVVVAREIGKPPKNKMMPRFEIFFKRPPEVCESIPAARIASLLPGKVVVIAETIWSRQCHHLTIRFLLSGTFFRQSGLSNLEYMQVFVGKERETICRSSG